MKFKGATCHGSLAEANYRKKETGCYFLPTHRSNQQNVNKPCKQRPDASIEKVFLDAIRQSHGIHPPSEITDIVFTSKGQYYFKPLRATKSNPSLCTKFDAPQTASRIRGDPIGIARVVVTRRSRSVDIAKIVRVASIHRAQPPIRRGFIRM